MGEMADYTLSLIEEDLYFGNVMYDDETDTYYPPKFQKLLICKFCGKKDLHWNLINNRWLMYEKSGDVHNCKEHPLSINILKEIFEYNKKNKRNK